MEISYRIVKETVCIDKIENPGTVVVVPEEVEGRPVTELGAYVLSGSRVEEVYLPSHLVKIGAYGFYGCEELRRLHVYGRLTDLGTGLFAGVQGVEHLEFTEFAGERSGFKELLSELRQTLRVTLWRREADGKTTQARLIFPEYYEESVENTPARILFIETHGCGHRYRYCFVNRQFQFRGYDELFPHVQVQESEELVTELALGRLLYPVELTPRFEAMYREYVKEHWNAAGRLLIEADSPQKGRRASLEPGRLPWLVTEILERAGDGEEPVSAEEGKNQLTDRIEALIALAREAEDTEMVSWLMDYRHERKDEKQIGEVGRENAGGQAAEDGSKGRRRRRFEL